MLPASAGDEGRNPDEAPLYMWQFIPAAEYVAPPPGVMETTRRRIGTLWRRLRPDIEEPMPHVKAEDELTRLPEWQLRRAAPPPDWAEAAEALDTALEDWVRGLPEEGPVRLLVAPPHIERGSILAAWADQHEWRLLSPPSPDQILSADGDWFSEQFSDDGPWVLPDLEQLYLRHVKGLDLISSFLDQAHAGNLGPGLIGSDSWAWAFLDHVWRGWLPPALTLQAYDEGRLAVCLRHLAQTVGGQQMRFRQSDEGSDVLPPPGSAAKDHKSEFLHHLAAYSRGNLAVAWAIWRTALSSQPLNEGPEEVERGADSRADDLGDAVVPSEAPRPSLGGGVGQCFRAPRPAAPRWPDDQDGAATAARDRQPDHGDSRFAAARSAGRGRR